MNTIGDDPKFDSVAMKVGRRGPDKLLTTFSKTPFLFWLSASLVVHLSIAVFISYGYLRDHYIDPEGAAARKAAAVAAEQAATRPAAGAAKTPAPPAAPTSLKETPPAPSSATSSVDRLMEEHKTAPIVKKITESAKPNEIPKQPDDLNISLDDTNPK